MITHNIGGLEVKMWDSIDELPVDRFSAYNKFILLEMNIGSDLDSLNDHFAKIHSLAEHGKMEDIKTEMYNAQQNMMFIMENVDLKMSAFAALVHKVDGRTFNDLSDQGIKELQKKLSRRRFTIGWLTDILSDFKKKVEGEFDVYFPERKNSIKNIEYYSKLNKTTELILGEILGEDNGKEIHDLEGEMLNFLRPKVMWGAKGEEAKHIVGFEDTCVLLTQQLSVDPKKMTTLSFYRALEVIQKQNQS